MEKTIEEVRAFFAEDKFATNNGAVIEAFDDGYARCSIELNENHYNAVGGVQGGVHYMLADFTFAVATNWKECRTVSLHCDIAYLGTVKGTKLIAEVTEIIKPKVFNKNARVKFNFRQIILPSGQTIISQGCWRISPSQMSSNSTASQNF